MDITPLLGSRKHPVFNLIILFLSAFNLDVQKEAKLRWSFCVPPGCTVFVGGPNPAVPHGRVIQTQRPELDPSVADR